MTLARCRSFVLPVLALLATMAVADRPGSLGSEASHYKVTSHAGGHFTKDHHKAEHIGHDLGHGRTGKKGHEKKGEQIEPDAADEPAADGAAAEPAADGPATGGEKPEKWVDYPPVGNLACGQTFLGGPDVNDCPKDCEYAAELDTSSTPENECHFKCVKEDQCGLDGTMGKYTIPDEEENVCRQCDVEGCLTCVTGKPGEDKELCTTCMPGYYKVDADGDGNAKECRSWTVWIFIGLAVVALLGTIGFLVWYLELVNREVVNEEGLQYALECRSRSKVRQPANTVPSENPDDGIGPRLLYPFNTNLCTTNVAGPGNMFFFRFQAVAIIWGIVLMGVWCAACAYIDPHLFLVGFGAAPTPQQMCYAIKMGRRMQLHYIWVKVYWCAFAYGFSVLGALWYAVDSQRLFQTMDNENTTMADYVALCRSLPVMKGDENVEEKIKEAIEKETGQKVVGISVCWNFHPQICAVKEALEADIGSIEHAKSTNTHYAIPNHKAEAQAITHSADESTGCLTGPMDWINNMTLKKWHCHFHEHEEGAEEKSEEEKAAEVVEMLHGLENTEMAFAVFETEDGRDKALEAVKGRPIPLNDGGFFLQYEDHEPESCCWEDFSVTEGEISKRISQGVLWMFVALCGWTFLLYAPYAHYMGSFSYANGDEPGEMSEGIFVGLVVGAQIGLFVVASMAAHHSGLCFEDDRIKVYIMLYNTALILNLILDMTLTAGLAYKQMCGRGVRTANGTLLSDLDNLQAILESFPMQKAIGKNLMAYCFPATFFCPFAAEPLACQVGPYLVGTYLVRSNKKMQGENAEKALELSEAEAGRYADVMFNVILVSVVPFLGAGYMGLVMGAFLFSHIFIYCYDHWRVLRCCTRFWFASAEVNTFAQKIFAIPVGILLTTLVFKWNQQEGAKISSGLATGPLKGPTLWWTMAGCFFGHCFMHWIMLDWIVPLFGVGENKNTEEPYEECAKVIPSSWFSTNPVHCLRSKYIKKDDPPQTFFVIGKEHLMKKNPAISAYYEAEAFCQKDVMGL